MQRRDFLKSVATGAGLVILPSGTLTGRQAPSNKLNVALIGVWGRGLAHQQQISSENIVALCDIDENHLAEAAVKFPKAKTYVDWRKCLEQKDIDAVLCCTPDHTHALIAVAAMKRGLHIYMEKPVANTIEEARLVRKVYLENRSKLATQVGTQRHQNVNFNRVRELIKDGAVGELRHVYAWGNRKIPKPGYLPASGTPPATLHYDLWLGPSVFHPYNPEYFAGKPGANCLNWNMYWDFGTGQIGDMGSHTMDLAWNAIDATLPTSAEAKGDPFNPDVTPVQLQMTLEHPANDWRPAIGVSWYQGGAMPISPKPYLDLTKIGHGVMFKGTKGFLVADFESRILLPFGDQADMTYYTRRPADAMIPPMGHFQKQWSDACKGNLKTACDFEYGANLIEQMLLGVVAYRVGKKLEYDPVAGRVTNDEQANLLLRRQYREGWGLDS